MPDRDQTCQEVHMSPFKSELLAPSKAGMHQAREEGSKFGTQGLTNGCLFLGHDEFDPALGLLELGDSLHRIVDQKPVSLRPTEHCPKKRPVAVGGRLLISF